VSVNQDNGYLKVLFYAKYWITNKTDQTLQYSVSDSVFVMITVTMVMITLHRVMS